MLARGADFVVAMKVERGTKRRSPTTVLLDVSKTCLIALRSIHTSRYIYIATVGGPNEARKIFPYRGTDKSRCPDG